MIKSAPSTTTKPLYVWSEWLETYPHAAEPMRCTGAATVNLIKLPRRVEAR